MPIKKLTEREHIIQRPAMYIGATDLTTQHEYLFEDGAVNYKEVSYVPGFIKIINEIIDNSVDVAIKSGFKDCDTISVRMTPEWVEVIDNGTGIPVQEVEWNMIFLADGSTLHVGSDWSSNEYKYTEEKGHIICHDTALGKKENLGKGFFRTEKHQLAELAWGHARAGSNFDDDENRTQIGMNGVGSFATNCFSKKFMGCTDDGTDRYTITFKNNAETYTDKLDKSSGRSGVHVKFWPDFEKFGLTCIDEIHMNIIKQRLINLSMSFPEITFKFNGRKIGVNTFKRYAALFGDTFEIFETQDYKFAILPNDADDFRQFSYVNGLKIPDGGTHIDLITNTVVFHLRARLAKKYPSIKPGDIRNKIMVIAFLKNVKNTKFNSQSKEKITNSVAEMNKYFGEIPYEKIAYRIFKNPTMIDPITEIYRIKEEFKRRAELKGLNKSKKKIKSEKYYPSIGTKKYLMLVEGESAFGGLSPVFGRKECGYYVLRGIPLNAYSASQSKMTDNKELSELYQIIQNEGYEYVIYATDQDLDGFHIRGLLTGFFVRYLPELKGRIGMLQTPVIGITKKDKMVRWHYNLSDDIKLKSGEVSSYYKGLGSWDVEDLKHVVSTDGVQKMIDIIDFNSDEIIEEWLGTDSAPRKKYILENNFSIAKL
jgi:DNA gyrase/topoisomerase IV subunit B